jgi:hypothetical protein
MAIGTYAVKLDNVVIDIIQFDVLSGEAIPVEGATLERVGYPTPTPIPDIGDIGTEYGFIKP